jgi:hypothetical protein
VVLEKIRTTKLWEATGQKSVILQIVMRKWRWIGRTLKGDESTEEEGNPREARWRGRPKQIRKMTVLEKAGKCGETGREVKNLAGNTVRWKCFASALCF